MTPSSRTRTTALVAFTWGLAEATFFFVVPDVWLTWIAVDRGLREGWRACLWALVGALVGGSALYAWGHSDPEGILRLLDCVPAISESMIAGVRSALDEDGVRAVLLGPLAGVPFKIFAAQAHPAGVGLGAFLAVGAVSRLARFVFATLLAWGVMRLLLDKATARTRRLVLLGTWGAFYAVYFSVMPG